MNLFISYGHGDYPTFIERLVSDLRKEHEVWVDHELRAGDVWSFEIELAIDRCDNFIFIIGPMAVRMDSYCYKEIKYAMDHGKRIIPISLDNTLILSLPDTTDADYVDITKIQYVDMCGSVNILNEINEEEYCKQFKSLQYELCQDNGASKGEYNYHQLSDKHRPDLSQSLRNNCDKIISMNFGPNGINEAYLSQLHPKAKLEGFDDYYQTLGELISAYSKRASEMSRDPDIRFLISGDVYMGRTSQLLYYCQKSLNDPENIKIIFYIPPFVLDHMDLFTYIYDTYLKEFPALCLTGDPKKAFRFFKDNLGTQRKIVLLIDDYDSIPKEKKKEFDRIFKQEDSLIDHVDVIIKIRYKDASWHQNYLEIAATGVDENKVRQIAHDNGIKPDDISPVLSSLQSPRFLKLLIDDALDGTYTVGNPGLLLRQNIENRVKEAAAQKDGLGMNILKFSIHALLPQLEAVQDFNIAHLYNNLPMIIEDIVSRGIYYEGFEIIEYFEELKNGTGANGNIFKEFFREPVVNTMDLMSDPSELDITTNTYIWKDRTVGDYFYAAAILHLFNAGSGEEAIRLISQLTSDLMVLEKPLLHSSVDPSVFVSFDRARYLIDIIDDSVLNKLKKTYPKEITLLYCGLSLVYELLGNEQDQYRFALAALSMLNQMYQSAYTDRGFIARWLHKMSYYVIKCNGEGLENFQDSLLSTKEYLEKAIDIAESEKPENLSTLELSKMYGNMGAYYLRKKAYPTAMDWHKKSLETKELYLSQCEPSEKEETEEGIRRSLVSLATDCFYLGKYKDSVAYHKSAIEVGKKIQSFFRYESYSRIAGSYISLFNQEKSWSCEAAEELLDLLTEGIRLMGELVNRRELNIIHQRCEKILSILKANGYVLSGLKESSFFTKVCFIEDQYNMITWNTDTCLSDYFE